MTSVTLQDLQRDLAGLLERVEVGERIFVSRAGRPVVELRPIALASRDLRPIGLVAGDFAAPEDFNAPLPDELLRAFEGS